MFHPPSRCCISVWLLTPFSRLGASGSDDNPRRFDKSIQDAFDNGVIPPERLSQIGLAIAGPVADAIGVRLLDLPMTPDRVLAALKTGQEGA